MKKLLFSLFIVLSTSGFTQQTLVWKILHPLSKTWIPLGVKGSVQEALIASGELPDPFVGKNEELFQWIEEHDWIFESNFSISSEQMKQAIDIEFPNVDTYAKFFINDQLIDSTDNSFVTYRFGINKWMKLGQNNIRLVFQSPINYQHNRKEEVGVMLPAPNDVGKEKVAPYCRKPQYQFGWDWSLRMNTIGFWSPVSLIAYNQNRVIGKGITTRSIDSIQAIQEFQLVLRESSNQTYIWKSKLFGNQIVDSKNGIIDRTETVVNPKLWWPRGQGESHLYTDFWTLETEEGLIVYQEKIRFGIRISELIQKEDEWGVSYVIQLNGRPIFCKGADYIPDDIFPARITEATIIRNIQSMVESNFNMVRVWGGGFYPTETFYNTCDSLGIMVWQDFMFACAMYPGNDAFLKTVKPEFQQQIPRIASHPSLVLFNGNNEVDVAWKNWGFQQQYSLSPKECSRIEEYYATLFQTVIPQQVAQYTNLPYVHTSPLSNWGKDEFFNNGTMHYWGVWHGKDPLTDFGTKIGRFNAEYGFQSFPEFSTLRSFSDTTDWDLKSDVMKHHQKSYVGNGMIAKHADDLFGKAEDFKRFVYYSQLTQREAVSLAINGHRLDAPRCSGTIFWQYNDCWPAPTWSSVDYKGNWKALQYQVKKDFEDATVLNKKSENGEEAYFFLNDSPTFKLKKLTCELFNLEGETISSVVYDSLQYVQNRMSLIEKEALQLKDSNYFVLFSWVDSFGNQYNKSFCHVPNAIKIADSKSISIKLTNIDLELKKATLEIINTSFIQDLWFSCQEKSVHFEQNFINILPGKHLVNVRFNSPPSIAELELFWR